jgi:hypothetical protein
MTVVHSSSSRDDDIGLRADRRRTVDSLDFEKAEVDAANAREALRPDVTRFHEFAEQEQSALVQHVRDYNAKMQLEIGSLVEEIRHKGQTKFTELVMRHRREANDLRIRWIKNHEQAEAVARRKISDMLHTSKVLASLESFENARDLRDRTQGGEDEIVAEEVRSGDAHFRTQFERMIRRHKQQYDTLLVEMDRAIELAKGEFKVKRAKFKGETEFEQAMSPVRTLNRIYDSEFSAIEKKSLVASLSPSRLKEVRSPAPTLSRSLMT